MNKNVKETSKEASVTHPKTAKKNEKCPKFLPQLQILQTMILDDCEKDDPNK